MNYLPTQIHPLLTPYIKQNVDFNLINEIGSLDVANRINAIEPLRDEAEIIRRTQLKNEQDGSELYRQIVESLNKSQHLPDSPRLGP